MKPTCIESTGRFLWMGLLLVIVGIGMFPARGEAAPYFQGDALVDSPIAQVLPHGGLMVGVGTVFADARSPERQETLFQLQVGILDRFELGLMRLWAGDQDRVQAHLRWRVLRERGGRPALAIGLEGIGEAPEGAQRWAIRYRTRSVYGVLSKRLTLPLLQQFDVHLGWGGGRYRQEGTAQAWIHGAFLGLQKRWSPRWIRGAILWNLDINAHATHVGVRYRLEGGVELQGAFVGLTEDSQIRGWLGVAWSNRALQAQIEEAKRLARMAAKLALQEGEDALNPDE